MKESQGRIDWRPRLKVWVAVRYMPKGKWGEYDIGRFATREEAAEALQTAVAHSRNAS